MALMLQKDFGNLYLESGMEILILMMEDLVSYTCNTKRESNRLKALECLTRALTKSDNNLEQIRDKIATDLKFCLMVCVICYVRNLGYVIFIQKANNAYEEKLSHEHVPEQTMFSLSWDVKELKSVNAECCTLFNEIEWCIDACNSGLFQRLNVPRKLTAIKSKLSDVIRRTVHFQRSPATHVFVFMVSSESRSKKPYALPVQCIPFARLKEVKLRQLINDLCKEMTSLGLNVSGEELYLWIVLNF